MVTANKENNMTKPTEFGITPDSRKHTSLKYEVNGTDNNIEEWQALNLLTTAGIDPDKVSSVETFGVNHLIVTMIVPAVKADDE